MIQNLGGVKGTEHPYSNFGNFQTLNYRLSAENFSLLLESRVRYAAYRIQPFFVGGIGASWNDVKHNVAYNLALSYHYFNFGSYELKQSVIQTANRTLKINTLDTQAILLNFFEWVEQIDLTHLM